jgi:hypothetical protein
MQHKSNDSHVSSIRSGQEWLSWIKYISWFYYANEAAVINQWWDVKSLPCENLDFGSPCIQTGDEVVTFIGFKEVRRHSFEQSDDASLCFSRISVVISV